MFKIIIENERLAFLDIMNSSNDFGVFSKSKVDFFVGYKESPFFEINHSLVNERWFIEVLPEGKQIPYQNIIFNKTIEEWFRDSCCTDFSLLNVLPDGKYSLIKTERKLQFTEKILFGNEWVNSPKNILCFKDSDGNGISPIRKGDKIMGNLKYYSMIVGSDIQLPPAINQPLLGLVLFDFGIVWEGATGFMFFSFEKKESFTTEDKKIILVIPYNDDFILDCMNTKNEKDKKIIDDFIKII